jgi:acyl-CoA dehydrogenase
VNTLLLNPKKHDRYYSDERSREIMLKTIGFFEAKGKQRLKKDDRECNWYADFLEFQKCEKLFATLLTPAAYGNPDCRWDTWRNCEFNEILAFYGLGYWYTWQVSILGLGPIWQSENEALKRKAAQLLDEGEVFAFGLSERQHGADIYSTEMSLTPQPDGTYRANGEKYYIGNGNIAPMVSNFGKINPPGDYVFFVADYRHKGYELIKNITNSQSYVANFALHEYGQYRKIQPGLGLDRYLYACILRSHPACRQPALIWDGRDGLSACEDDVHRGLCPPGGDEAVLVESGRLYAHSQCGRPALLAL